jgi:hypothetical protein
MTSRVFCAHSLKNIMSFLQFYVIPLIWLIISAAIFHPSHLASSILVTVFRAKRRMLFPHFKASALRKQLNGLEGCTWAFAEDSK